MNYLPNSREKLSDLEQVADLGQDISVIESSFEARALKRTGFCETLRYDATTTTVDLSSVAHKLVHSTVSDLEPDLESDHVVYK